MKSKNTKHEDEKDEAYPILQPPSFRCENRVGYSIPSACIKSGVVPVTVLVKALCVAFHSK